MMAEDHTRTILDLLAEAVRVLPNGTAKERAKYVMDRRVQAGLPVDGPDVVVGREPQEE